jgi:ubiquinone biosynthesis protein COQ9
MTPDPLRDAAIGALLARLPAGGWTRATLRQAVTDSGQDAELVASLFPRGVVSAIEAWSELADRRMAEAAAAEDLLALRTPARIRRLIELRLGAVELDREALRGALAILALPWNAPLAARLMARSVSAIWYAAGDRSSDFSWYTRRATLAAVYGATLAFWMRPTRPEMAEVLGFLDRRLAELPRPRRG